MQSIRFHHLFNLSSTFEYIYQKIQVTWENVHLINEEELRRIIFEIELQRSRNASESLSNWMGGMVFDYFGSYYASRERIHAHTTKVTENILKLALALPQTQVAITGMQDSIFCSACVRHKHCLVEDEFQNDTEEINDLFPKDRIGTYHAGRFSFPFVIVHAGVIKRACEDWVEGEGRDLLVNSAIPIQRHPGNLVLEGFLDKYV